jgi:hypothetical protein
LVIGFLNFDIVWNLEIGIWNFIALDLKARTLLPVRVMLDVDIDLDKHRFLDTFAEFIYSELTTRAGGVIFAEYQRPLHMLSQMP